jgi:hypothetical protein
MTYDDVVDDLIHRYPHVGTKKMFGMECFTVNGKAVGGRADDGLLVKLTDSALHAEAMALSGSHAFDPMGGRPMKQWVVVPHAHAAQWARLAEAAVS